MIAKQQWNKLLQLVAILTICNCQEYHIKPDNCLHEECCSYPPPDCMTLSEYVLNVNNYNYNNLMLSPGEYYLNSTLSINSTATNTQDISIIGSGSESTSIICTQNATLEAFLLDTLTIENVSFVSCGVDTTPGVSLNNIDTVNITDTSFSSSTSGALDIQHCSNVHLTSLKIVNNTNSRSTIVFMKNSSVVLKDLLMVNNSIKIFDSACALDTKTLDNEVIFKIFQGSLEGEDIRVLDNIGPFGVMVVNNMAGVLGNREWIFKQNQVCFGGSLAFIKSINNTFNGNLSFIKNKAITDTFEHTAGLFQQDSVLNILSGSVDFIGNEGYIACYVSITAHLNINAGALCIHNSSDSSFQAVFLERDSTLIVQGSFIAIDNQFKQRIFLSESSEISVTGLVNTTNNPCSPIAVYNSKLTFKGKLYFSNNSGIIFASKSKIEIRADNNSTFIHNSVEDDYTDGSLAIFESNLFIEGNYTFRDALYDDENGGGIFASIGSTVTLGGIGYFINNTANNGGGIFIDQLSRLELRKDTQLCFMNNTAIKGAGIFLSTSVQHAECNSSQTDCLFGFKDGNNSNVSLVFQHNKAYPGASVIHVNFDHIEDRSHTFQSLMDLNDTINTTASSFIGNSLPHFASDTYWFCFCKDNSPENCNRTDQPMNITAYKGTPFSIRAKILKFYGSNMSEPVRASLMSSLNAVDRDSTPNSTLTSNNDKLQSASAINCSNFTFSIKSTAENETILMTAGESFLDEEKSLKVNVRFNPFCPPGFPLNEGRNSCECDVNIRIYLQKCEITDTIFLKRNDSINYWIGPSDDPAHQGAMSWYKNCPNRYCITNENFTFSEDGICANNRAGRLCGECKGNYSLLLGGDICGDCSDNAYLALILVFAVAGVLLIALIFLTQITVTTGTINGLIFYVNILNSNQASFFPENFFPGYSVFISWLNLNFGFETCFFDGMNQLVYSGLQFVFPLYLWFLAGVIIFLCRYSLRISRFFGNSDPVAVLATIILLSFNSLVQNIIGIFYLSNLHLPNGTTVPVWRYDGSVDFYIDKSHFILLVVSAVFLLFLLTPYTLVLLTAPLLQKSDRISKMLRKMKLQPFIFIYQVPFKPQHRYWVGLCLFMRVMLLITFSVGENRQLNLLLITTACVVAISMFTITGGIYDKKWIDKLEVSFLINLGVLAAATSFSFSLSNNGQREIATYISITVALLTFIGIVLLHIFWRLKKFKKANKAVQLINNKLNFSKKQNLDINESTSTGDNDDASISTIGTTTTFQVELREPLLESLVN